MRSRAALFIALALLFFAAPARAFDTPALTPEQRDAVIRIGNSFRVVAVRFKCGDFIWGNISPDGREVYLKYQPPGADPDMVKRQLTVTVYGLPSDPYNALKRMEMLRTELQERAHKLENALVVTDEAFLTRDKQPGLFLDYQAGVGSTRIRAAGVLLRGSPDSAAFIQIEAHGHSRPEPGDADEIRRLADIVTLKDNEQKDGAQKDVKKP
jgi:hypothetical protein